MPKDRSGRSHSSNRSKRYPYPCGSGHAVRSFSKRSRDSVEDVKEWDEARCPVCMEHPHNAVLLLCSSHEKGCRPFMCDTSSRHSNCFDQYRKTFAESPTSSSGDGTFQSSTVTVRAPHVPSRVHGVAEFAPGQSLHSDNKTKLNVVCPLCRGRVNGWKVVEDARRFMNSKTRSCACETCDFNGTYTDLRKHARAVHPQARPSEADPVRQRDWRRMEQENDLRDVVSTIGSVFTEDNEILGSEPIRVALIFHLSQVSTARGQRSITRSSISFRRQSSSTPPVVHSDTDTDSDALLGNDWMDFAQSPQYGPVYTPLSPGYSPRRGPRFSPGSPWHNPGYSPRRSPGYSPGRSPWFSPGSPWYNPPSPTYCPTSPTYCPSSPAYSPRSPGYCPRSPVSHSSPGYGPSSPGYCPSSPGYSPMNPEYSPIEPEYTARQPTLGHTMRSTSPGYSSRQSRSSQSPRHSGRSHQQQNQRESSRQQ